MRKRFEQQLVIGTKLISDLIIPLKSRDAIPAILISLKEIFINPEYNSKVFCILEDKLITGKNKTGRPGMDLWQIFVLAQFRVGLNLTYDRLDWMANHDVLLRQLLGIETETGFERETISYQSIIDNVSLLDAETVNKLNDVIVEMGHNVFKKKEESPLSIKTDSFVVLSNVHFPTDYNLLWDCARKSLDAVQYFLNKYPETEGWRKINNWKSEVKILMRKLGRASASGGKNKENRTNESATLYIVKAKVLHTKLINSIEKFPIVDVVDLAHLMALERFIELLAKHIDLVERRLLKGEKIPHEEKMFSIFETYTEWITKGKLSPSVELGKVVNITSDQFGLIIIHGIIENQADSETVLPLADSILGKFKIESWSFDKGYYSKINKELLKSEILNVIMPKKGKLNTEEKEEESCKIFKNLRNKHSAVESNINELGHRGLDRCPDRGYEHFKLYIALGVSSYNLHRIGKYLLEKRREKIKAISKAA